MLGTLENKEKQDWKKYISSLVHAYNCTKHESTGYSPFELMFGRKPRLPIDLTFGLPEEHNTKESYSEFITELRDRIKETFELVKNTAESSRHKQKMNFDKKAKAKKLNIGDQVLLKILAYDGKHKIADKFEETIYTIKSQPNTDIPVYVITAEDGHEKTIHRNLIIPIGTTFRPKPAERKGLGERNPRIEEKQDEQRKESDSEDEEQFVTIQIERGHTDKQKDTTMAPQPLEIHEAHDHAEVQAEEELVEDDSVEEVRRSSRTRKKPKWHDAYVMSQTQEVENRQERAQLLANLFCSNILKSTSPSLIENIVHSIIK
ncbi:uncharacterized protein LOC130055173 [Ostrea edulis]|uniref:uncharacterized protein LOC130055173 n=1 Tax=Ostrea edulis TaxID=37623 RepID=UPI0024AF1323|nr:uncharacterized protein LOC130055173 [Ostrea edulis]XP_056022860.1 uncharacterized protein LOC130055173 [Ostrea edulis]XP_056022861.1 uncharacterized protein LOC130055173 [Ostrea edulis]